MEEELIARVAWFIRLRYLAGAGVVAAVFFATGIFRFPLPQIALYLIAAGILVYNFIFWLFLKRLQKESNPLIILYKGFAHLQISFDWIALTLLVHFSGGIENPFIFYFIFHMIIGSILLSVRACYTQVTLALILLFGNILLEYYRVIPHVNLFNLPYPLYSNSAYVFSMLFVFTSTAYISAYLATSISGRLRFRSRELMSLKESLENAYSRVRVLSDVAKVINASLRLEQVLDTVTQNAAELMEAKASSIRLLDERGERMEISADWGLSEEYLKKGPVEVDKSRVDQEVLRGKAVIIPDATDDPRFQYPEAARREGIRSVLSVPLAIKERNIGVLRVYKSAVYKFTSEEIDYLSALASQSAIAIENARAYGTLEKINREKTEFFMRATHELRAPLAAIQSCLKVILEGYTAAIDEKSREMIARAEARAGGMLRLIADLLNLSFLLGERRPRVTERLSVPAAVKGNVELITPSAKLKRITLEVAYPPAELYTEVNRDDLDLIIISLLNNAANYSREGGRITVTVSERRDEILVGVKDEGIGIAPDDLGKIFQDFYRSAAARERVKDGTGLGLSIVKEVVERYQGRIWAESEGAGKGAKFTFTLPKAN